jgi:ABC-2 type transport system ATP-binding protein
MARGSRVQHRYPLHEVGALLDARAVHGGRSAYSHLLCLAQAKRIPRRRVSEVLDLVGLSVWVVAAPAGSPSG